MGAMTALTYATRHPERLRTAIVAGINPEREPRSSVAARLMDPERIDRDEPAWAAQLERARPGAGARRLADGCCARSPPSRRAGGADAEQLRRARLPILLAVGDRDVFVPLDQAVRLHRQLPDSRLLVVPDSGHVVTVTQPALFNQPVATFWRRSWSGHGRRPVAMGDCAGSTTAVTAGTAAV